MVASRYSLPNSRWRAHTLLQAADHALAVRVATPTSKAKEKELPPRWQGCRVLSQSLSSLLLQLSNLSPWFSTRCHHSTLPHTHLLPLGYTAEKQSRSIVHLSGQSCLLSCYREMNLLWSATVKESAWHQMQQPMSIQQRTSVLGIESNSPCRYCNAHLCWAEICIFLEEAGWQRSVTTTLGVPLRHGA